jgi:putative membrane-bound dehydrogenase-like protein
MGKALMDAAQVRMIPRKGAKAQRESPPIPSFFLCAFAPLREVFLLATFAVSLAFHACAAEPRVLVEEYRLVQVAREPEIVTPIGMAFDSRGRLLVVESHTHQRPDGYDGPAGDCVRILADSDGDDKLDRWSTFAEGFQQAMNVCARPDGGVYVVTRREVRLFHDADDDGAADDDGRVILNLETPENYPHNAMSGIVLENAANEEARLYLGVGENSGIDYTIVGSDGVRIENTGGVGVVYRSRLDGSELEVVATGFWNPFSLCLGGGRLFCVDNDPDASPPCRLLEVVDGGDYGFRYEYGRAGVHPLIAWNGELPGTLPMICGVGEGPTAIVNHRGYLWVTSWGDHRIEQYELAPRGSSVSATRTVIVQGDADFRPTGAAVAPDGSLYFADWVDRSYPVHSRGRIWRLTLPKSEEVTLPPRQFLSSSLSEAEYAADPFAQQVLASAWARPELPISSAIKEASAKPPLFRLAALKALKFRTTNASREMEPLVREALADEDADVRLYAVRWAADERMTALRDEIAKLLDSEIPSERYFLAVLGAVEWLDGDRKMRNREISDSLLMRELRNSKRSDALKALALRLASPDHEWLTLERLQKFLDSDHSELRLEAVRTLAMRSDPEREAALAEIAADEQRDDELRVEAVVGLAPFVVSQERLLAKLAEGDDGQIAEEARRVLRLAGKREAPADAKLPATADLRQAAELDKWSELLSEGGDAASGRRLFFTAAGPQCAACHQHRGRGGRIGPDLSRLGRQQARQRIIASILQPSREIAPEFQSWTLLTHDGLTRSGFRLPQGGDDGMEPYADAAGRVFKLRSEEIAEREPSDKSIMPEGVESVLTVEDLRDLVAFLSSP